MQSWRRVCSFINGKNKRLDAQFSFCSSYGSVHKAIHKESGEVLAVKRVPVDTDLQEIIKEITIMQQCDSKFVVKYFGSYFISAELWVSAALTAMRLCKTNLKHLQIVMEYCGAGSVSDIMKLRRKTLTEEEMSVIVRDTLMGLSYLHSMKKMYVPILCKAIVERFATALDIEI